MDDGDGACRSPPHRAHGGMRATACDRCRRTQRGVLGESREIPACLSRGTAMLRCWRFPAKGVARSRSRSWRTLTCEWVLRAGDRAGVTRTVYTSVSHIVVDVECRLMLGAWLAWGGVAWLASRWSPGLPASVPEPSLYGASNGHVGWSRTNVDAVEVLSEKSVLVSHERARGKPGLDALDPSSNDLKQGTCPGDFMRRSSALQHDRAEQMLGTRPSNLPVEIETAIAGPASGRATTGSCQEAMHHGVADGVSSRCGGCIPRLPVACRNVESTRGNERERSDRNGARKRVPGAVASGFREDASPDCEAGRRVRHASNTFVSANGVERVLAAEESLHQADNWKLYPKLVSAGSQDSPAKNSTGSENGTQAINRFSGPSGQPSSKLVSFYRRASPVRLRDTPQLPDKSSFEDGLIHCGTSVSTGVLVSKMAKQQLVNPADPRASEALKYESGNSLTSPAPMNRCAVFGNISHSQTVSEIQPHSGNCLEARTITANSNSEALRQTTPKHSERSKSALFADDTWTGRHAERLAPSVAGNPSSSSDGETTRARLARSPSNGPMLPRHLSPSDDRPSEADDGSHFSVPPRAVTSKLPTEEESSHDARRSSAWSTQAERQHDSPTFAKDTDQYEPILGRASGKTMPRRTRGNPPHIEGAAASDEDGLEYRAVLQSQTPSHLEQRLWMNPLDGIDEAGDDALQRQRGPRSMPSTEYKELRRFAGDGRIAGLRENRASPANRSNSISPSAQSMPSFIPLESPPKARSRYSAISACSRGISARNATPSGTSISPTCFRGTQATSRPLESKTRSFSSPIWGMLHQAVESVSGGSPFVVPRGQRQRRGIKQHRIHSTPLHSRRRPSRRPSEEAHQRERETKIQLSDLSEDSASPIYSTRILAELDAAHQENEFLREHLSRMAVQLDTMRTQQRTSTGSHRPDEHAKGLGEPKLPDQALKHRERRTLLASDPGVELTPASTHEKPSTLSNENHGRIFPDTRRGGPRAASGPARVAHDRAGRSTSPLLTVSKASIEKRALSSHEEYWPFIFSETDAGPARALKKTADVIGTPNRVSPKRVSSTQRSSPVVLYPNTSVEHCCQQQM